MYSRISRKIFGQNLDLKVMGATYMWVVKWRIFVQPPKCAVSDEPITAALQRRWQSKLLHGRPCSDTWQRPFPCVTSHGDGSQPYNRIGSHLSVHWCAWLLGTGQRLPDLPSLISGSYIQQWCHTFFTETHAALFPLPPLVHCQIAVAYFRHTTDTMVSVMHQWSVT